MLTEIKSKLTSKTVYKVLVVDRDAYTLAIMQNIQDSMSNLRVYEAHSIIDAEELFTIHNFDIIVVNYNMTNGSVFNLIDYMRHDKKLLPIVVLIDRQNSIETEERVSLLQVGASFFLEKPFTLRELLLVIQNLVELNDTYRGLEHADNIMKALYRAIEARDPYTQGHTTRTADLAVKVFDKVGLVGEQREDLYAGCILHDIGKIALPDDILKSEKRLTDEQYKTVKSHPIVGEAICQGLHKLREALPIIRQHHERLDGSGYPDGLQQTEIHILAQIAAVADVYEALTSDRSYRPAMTCDEAFEIIEQEAKEGKLNPHFASVLRLVAEEDVAEGCKNSSP